MNRKYINISLLLLSALFILRCAPIVYSPHAQNEMITPYNRMGEIHEIGGAFAFNKWVVHQGGDTVYIKTYPSASLSLFHNAYTGWGRFGGIGGIELIGCPTQWEDPDISGFFLCLKPYLGFQYNGSFVTGRLNISPFSFVAGYGNGEWGVGCGPTKSTIYQLTILLHNLQSAKHTYWGGVRSSVGAIGFIGGYEYSFDNCWSLRAEYSYLMKPLFPILLTDDEFESIVGSVHYLTIGFFKRVK